MSKPDLYFAKGYVSKCDQAASRNLELTLSFSQFKKLMTTKKCFYTGLEMTMPNGSRAATDVTIDRKDNSIGYVPSNVVACCSHANNLKGTCEGDNSLINPQGLRKIADVLESAA